MNLNKSIYVPSVELYVTVRIRSVAEGGYPRRTVTGTATGPGPGYAVVPMETLS